MISQLAKPQIKGRGFLKSGQEIIETQTYYTQPEKDWVFDDTMALTYNNPVYKDQCKMKGIEIDDSGFVEQIKLDELKKTEEKSEVEEDIDDNDNDDDFDDDDDEPKFDFSSRTRSGPMSKPPKGKDDIPDFLKPSKKEESKSSESSKEKLSNLFGSDSKNDDDDPFADLVSGDELNGDLDMSDDDLSGLANFSNEAPTKLSVPNSPISEMSTRDKVNEALGTSIQKPKIKLNIDKTTSNSSKKGIKLNLKNKNNQ